MQKPNVRLCVAMLDQPSDILGRIYTFTDLLSFDKTHLLKLKYFYTFILIVYSNILNTSNTHSRINYYGLQNNLNTLAATL